MWAHTEVRLNGRGVVSKTLRLPLTSRQGHKAGQKACSGRG